MKLISVSSCLLLIVSATALAENVSEQPVNDNSKALPSIQKTQMIKLNSMDVINMLVKEGVLARKRAEELIQSAASEKINVNVNVNGNADKKSDGGDSTLEAKVVRVPYVPDYISKQIRDEVRLGLREDVVTDVIGQAKHERWGVPGTLPSWINRISFKGDFRLRYQGDIFGDQNKTVTGPFVYLDAQAVNEAGRIDGIESFHNIIEDEHRLRARLRLAMNAKVTEGVKVGMRVSTGSFNNPVSTNKTLGNNFKPYQLVLDRAFINIESEIKKHTFTGGRMPNPWLSTDLLWDKDLNFDGVVYKYRPLQSDNIFDEDRVFDSFLTFGAFPLDEIEVSSDDKWLFGFQSGLNWSFSNQNRLDIAIAYYDYSNIEGERNSPDSNLLDFTAPELVGKGNTLFNIVNSTTDPEASLYALAADYNIIDILLKYKLANFAPVNVDFILDYVENIGYDKEDIAERTGGDLLAVYDVGYFDNNGDFVNTIDEAQTTGYQIKVNVGWPTLSNRGNWQSSIAYKYLERDAVLDIFTDSDFRGGGTDAKGFVLQGKYAVENNTWLSLKLISANEISGLPYAQDTIQFDLNAKF